MAEHAKNALLLLLFGALVGGGVRAADWLIPAPETRIVVCFASELDQVEICKPASELLKKKGGT